MNKKLLGILVVIIMITCTLSVIGLRTKHEISKTDIITLNDPPDKPSTPLGTTSGKTGIVYDYTSSTIDPDGDKVIYGWDWEGDMIVDEWTDLHDSGEIVEMSHSWDIEGSYEIRVKAKDTYEVESPWSDPLSISMPKNKAINTPFLQFLENHLHLFRLLRKIFD